jgi:hypothetical protein
MKDNAIKTTKGSNAVANQVTQKKSAGKSMPSATVQMQEEEKDIPQMKADVVQRAGAEEEEKMQMKADVVQRAGAEEEEKMQMKADVVQRAAPEEELQMKKDVVQREADDEEKLQMKADVVQREADDEEKLQMKKDVVQREEAPAATSSTTNNTGMPDSMKSSMENMSGMDLSDVKVHKNSEKPKSMGALAYAQGTDIHVAPGQEQHLGHEAWHVVQQKQGRVKPTLQLKGGVPVNDDSALEQEADIMGARAAQTKK